MKVLVAGIGNIFMGDDGFGCEVVQRLARCEIPEGVDVVDFGIRGMDLSYALMEDYEAAILVDTAQRGEAPGTVYVIEPDLDEMAGPADESSEPMIAPHDMDPAKVLHLVASLGERRPRVMLVACEPQYLGEEHGHMGLSDAAGVAVDHAAEEVLDILKEWLSGETGGQPKPQRPVSA